jgi:hypothetical protein
MYNNSLGGLQLCRAFSRHQQNVASQCSKSLRSKTQEGKDQFPIYFVSRALQGVEINYQRLEKVAFALLIASRKLRPYFQCYPINQYDRYCISQTWPEG